MFNNSRRRFLSLTSRAAALVGLGSLISNTASATPPQRGFIHHVYFWLKDPKNERDRQKLIDGLKKLSEVPTIQEWHIGKPAATNREVIDNSYTISWMLVFKGKADQDSYQTDPIHLKFVETCSSLWTKVLVYDSEEI